MKRFLITAAALILSSFFAFAQTPENSGETEHAGNEVQVDSTIFGNDILSVMPGSVIIDQPESVARALAKQVEDNSARVVNGYRIRIYFDSGRNARGESEAVIRRFSERYPHIQAFRTFVSPNFKVTVGNFRTRVEAEAFLRDIKADFTEAFIVREKFKYPTIGKPDTSIPDTYTEQ